MAVSQASKTLWSIYSIEKHFNFDFVIGFRGLIIQTIKLKHGFYSEGWNLKMVSNTATISFIRPIWPKKISIKSILILTFLWMFKGQIIQTIKMKDWFDSEGWVIEDGVQDGRHFKAKINLKSNSS